MKQIITQQKPISNFTKAFILLIPLLVIGLFAAFFTNIFITLIICLLFALVLNPIVDFLQSKGINRTLAIIIIYAALGIGFYFAYKLIMPNISGQVTSLQRSYKEFELSDKIKVVEKWLEKNVPYMKKGDIATELQENFKGSVSKAQDLISGVLSTAFLIFIIPFITFFILRDRQLIKNSLISMVPNKYFEMAVNIFSKIETQLSSYVRGWLLDALFVGILSTIGLTLIGVNNSIIIGIVAGTGHLIPYMGPIVGGIPSILISIVQYGDFHMVLPIVIMFSIIYMLDNFIAQPYIFSKHANMNPITIIALILIGNEIFGVFGALMAIPIATILKVSARETINGFRNYKLGFY